MADEVLVDEPDGGWKETTVALAWQKSTAWREHGAAQAAVRGIQQESF